MNAKMNAKPIAALYDELGRYVARRVRADDVDDVVQDVLERIVRAEGGLRDRERFGPWIARIARNAVIDHQRRLGRQPTTVELDPALAAPVTEEDDEAAARLARCLSPMIEDLDPKYAEALRRVELDGLTQAAAAREVGVSVSGMKSRVQRGRARLHESVVTCCAVELDARRHVVDYAPRPSCC